MMQQKFNQSKMNARQMMGAQSMLSMQSLFQKIGKGKRKFKIRFDRNSKMFFNKFCTDYKKMMVKNGGMLPNVLEFFDYVITESKNKNTMEIYFSYEELEFFKKIFIETLKGMEEMNYKWYQFLKRIQKKFLVDNSKIMLKIFNS